MVVRGSSSVGRAIAFQAIGREFEPRLPLNGHGVQIKTKKTKAMKKFFAIMIAVSVFALASCGGNADTAVSGGADSTCVDSCAVDSTIIETPADTTATK